MFTVSNVQLIVWNSTSANGLISSVNVNSNILASFSVFVGCSAVVFCEGIGTGICISVLFCRPLYVNELQLNNYFKASTYIELFYNVRHRHA